jgi:hypothetical protein
MREMFPREHFGKVQEEINRLFRTNRYNLIKKRHEHDLLTHKYPSFRTQQTHAKNNLAFTLKHVAERTSEYRRYEKEKKQNSAHDYTNTLGTQKEMEFPDMEQRSPLLCTWLPSRKAMLGDFNIASAYTNHLQAVQRNEPSHRPRIAQVGLNMLRNVQT